MQRALAPLESLPARLGKDSNNNAAPEQPRLSAHRPRVRRGQRNEARAKSAAAGTGEQFHQRHSRMGLSPEERLYDGAELSVRGAGKSPTPEEKYHLAIVYIKSGNATKGQELLQAPLKADLKLFQNDQVSPDLR